MTGRGSLFPSTSGEEAAIGGFRPRAIARIAGFVLVVFAASWSVWYNWIYDGPSPADEMMEMTRDPTYQAGLLAMDVGAEDACTKSLAGTALPAPDSVPGEAAPFTLRRPGYGPPDERGDTPTVTLAEPDGTTSGGVWIVSLDFRPVRPISDTTWLGEVAFTLGAPDGHLGSVSDTVELVMHVEEEEDGPVVRSCYGVRLAAERCSDLGGRVVADRMDVGPDIERCTFTEGDTGTFTTLQELRERGRR